MSPFDEKRAHPREACDVPVTIATDELAWLARIVDISDDGVFVSSALQPSVGSVLPLKFRHPTHTSLMEVDGEVRHLVTQSVSEKRPTGFGVFVPRLAIRRSSAE